MSQHIEIEFKNILTKNEYEKLLAEFKIEKEDLFFQENHYFDTPDFSLKEKGSALRIRKKTSGFEMTLKQPAQVGLLETNQLLSEKEAVQALQQSIIPEGKIKSILLESRISLSAIKYFGSLATYRIEMKYKNGLLVLDHSLYLNKEDYELEYEAENYDDGMKAFSGLLHKYHIPKRETENKIIRFYKQKFAQKEKN